MVSGGSYGVPYFHISLSNTQFKQEKESSKLTTSNLYKYTHTHNILYIDRRDDIDVF